MILLGKMQSIVGNCGHPRHRYLMRMDGERPYLQVECEAKCNVTGKDLTWRGRKWFLSQHMTEGEIVQTAFLASKIAEEHELREQFTYRGVTVFEPHLNMEQLVALRANGKLGILEREGHETVPSSI